MKYIGIDLNKKIYNSFSIVLKKVISFKNILLTLGWAELTGMDSNNSFLQKSSITYILSKPFWVRICFKRLKPVENSLGPEKIVGPYSVLRNHITHARQHQTG